MSQYLPKIAERSNLLSEIVEISRFECDIVGIEYDLMWTEEVRVMELKIEILDRSLAFGHGLECNLFW